MKQEELKCAHCGKLLGKGEVIHLNIKCPRCGAPNTLRAMSTNQELKYSPKRQSHE